MIKRIVDIILYPWTEFKRRREMKKRLEELKKRDTLIYK